MALDFQAYDESPKYLKLGCLHLNNDGTVWGQPGNKTSKTALINALLYESEDKLEPPLTFACEIKTDEEYEKGSLKAKLKQLTEKYWAEIYKAVEKHGVAELSEALYQIGCLEGEKTYPQLMLELNPPEPEEVIEDEPVNDDQGVVLPEPVTEPEAESTSGGEAEADSGASEAGTDSPAGGTEEQSPVDDGSANPDDSASPNA